MCIICLLIGYTYLAIVTLGLVFGEMTTGWLIRIITIVLIVLQVLRPEAIG